MKVTIGFILKEIRIKRGETLRGFCIVRNLDPVRYSMIERDVLKPDLFELAKYLELIEGKERKAPVSFVIKDVGDTFGIRTFVRDIILPEIVEAVKDRSFREGLKEALGLE